MNKEELEKLLLLLRKLSNELRGYDEKDLVDKTILLVEFIEFEEKEN